MAGGGEEFFLGIGELYNALISLLPPIAQDFANLAMLSIASFLFVYLFFWKFYTFISAKNIFGLDLNQYNKSDDPFTTKLISGAFYFLEYLIILPFAIFSWFLVFALFLLILAQEMEVGTILMISTVIVVIVRLAAYYRETFSKDLAKLIPLTFLTFAITNLRTLNLNGILLHLQEVPNFFSQVFVYFIFIFGMELLLRVFDFLFSLFGLEDVGEEVKKDQEEKEEQEEQGEGEYSR